VLFFNDGTLISSVNGSYFGAGALLLWAVTLTAKEWWLTSGQEKSYFLLKYRSSNNI
jgi:hypothetical protein